MFITFFEYIFVPYANDEGGTILTKTLNYYPLNKIKQNKYG